MFETTAIVKTDLQCWEIQTI